MLQHNSLIPIIIILIILQGCATLPSVMNDNKEDRPDYNLLQNWASHPAIDDSADLTPEQLVEEDGTRLSVDVFFVHPTTYTRKPIRKSWNAPINDEKLNSQTDGSTIQFQASIFNLAERLYAPRYRQAHIRAYYDLEEKAAKEVFEIAYSDVKSAFYHFIENENRGRPFVLASHSQGTTHLTRLIAEEIDGQKLQSQLVAAYLVGMPLKQKEFQHVLPCKKPQDTGCFLTWRTFKKGFMPKDRVVGDSIAVHNPLSWSMDKEYSPKTTNSGAVLRNFNKVLVHATDAQVTNGILWASKPKFAFSFLFTRKNYHIADLNFYYLNVRENVKKRVKAFFKM